MVSAFLIHGTKYASSVIGIDTEDLIHIQGDFYGGWLNTGRQGLVFLKQIMGAMNFNPYFSGLLTLLFLGAATVSFFLLWDKADGGTTHATVPAVAGVLLLWISHPIITEQLYFSLQSAEICAGILLTAVSLYQVFRLTETKKKSRLIVSCLIQVLVFSIYQAFVPLFIFGAISIIILQSRQYMRQEEVAVDRLLLLPVPYLIVFLSGFLVNTIITGLFFQKSDYLYEQILWGRFAPIDNLRAITGHILKAFFGMGTPHYHVSYGILCLLSLLCLFRCFICSPKRKKSVYVVLIFYFAAWMLTPFLMTLLCGGAPVIRSQLVLPANTAFLAYFVLGEAGEIRMISEENRWKRIPVILGFAVCVFGVYRQTSVTERFYYTEQVRFDQDEALGRMLINRIDKLLLEEKLPVCVIGRKPFVGNHACLTGEIIGKSMFDHDVEVEPMYYWSTRRVLGFLHVLGGDYEEADMGRFQDAVSYSASMPVWPHEDSVQRYDGMIIIKLSEAGE